MRARRIRVAEAGLENLLRVVDTSIIIPNQNLFKIADEKTPLIHAFKMADNVLMHGVRGSTRSYCKTRSYEFRFC